MTQSREHRVSQLLMHAHELYGSQQYPAAETLYREVLNSDPANRDALQSLVAICLQTQRLEEAEQFLRQLVEAYPEEPSYCDHYANALMNRGNVDAAAACFHRLLEKQPQLAHSRYNFALLLKNAGRFDQALEQYQKALDLGIAQPEEVYSNISVIHSDQHRHEDAQAVLEKALALNPNYTPAMYNLALLEEERGNWQHARKLFQDILQRNPNHCDALVRLAHGQVVDEPEDPLIGQLQGALIDADENLTRESFLFALGKVHDDCSRYDAAFEHYRQGNQYAQQRVGDYDRTVHEKLIQELMDTFTPAWLAAVDPVSDSTPIFVCGMFRSGSTLLEQMLARHPELAAGGEINFFNVQAPLPEALAKLDQSRLRELGTAYLAHIASTFPGMQRVINKRPDNFLYLGLIRALFPNARIINILRNPLDNCLSVFFQQLATPFTYANDLLDIGHYYVQYRRLMDYWQETLPDHLIHVEYDELVKAPQSVLEPLLASFDLEWHEACLQFYSVGNRVRTASLWQVRQPLHLKSSGRSRHYAQQLDALRVYLREAGLA